MKPIRIIVADDHPMCRKGLAEAISAADSTELVGVAADGKQAAQLAVEQRPDVALLDIRMPEENGIDATIQITANAPETAVLILTMFDDDDLVFAALRAGARGYILKESSQDEVLHAITTVASGGANPRRRRGQPAQTVLREPHRARAVSRPDRARTAGTRTDRRRAIKPGDRPPPIDQ